MQTQFEQYIRQNKLFDKKDKIIVAFSGGADSVALAHLLIKSDYNIALAHVNFRLRGAESERDKHFCKSFAQKYGLKLFLLETNTLEYAQEKKLSVETAARELRYNWFKQLANSHSFDFIATAHHADDNVETVLFNCIRGTGIKGLKGIPVKNKNIVRPLLFANKQQILDYCHSNKLDFVTDSTNLQTDYSRNKIRHKIIPLLKEIFPKAKNNILTTAKNIKQSLDLYNELIEIQLKSISSTKEGKLIIDIDKLKQLNSAETFLYEILSPYGFNAKTISKILETEQSGKIFYANQYRLIVGRNELILTKQTKKQSNTIIINTPSYLETSSFKLFFEIETLDNVELKQPPNIAVFDYEKICFPLRIRKWQSGDYFYPFGMKGKKKVSDFFRDLKLTIDQKEQAFIMQDCNGKILWVIPYRTDNMVAVTKNTKQILKITFIKKPDA